ncbi:MAG: hypothetical protein CMM91_00720 [Rickettsiales bacterium]|nr:hypothetical protein [Rickettsiales bacterium]OUV54927.1 MAG: hypothetical protein CBC87_00225 [Rickettsiales bacterium TMED127]|tara:strand:- start:7223 stop:7621 length:399 start_codon:yes stop_codon:yes gene_type:complete
MSDVIGKYIKAYENINISSLNKLLSCIDENFLFLDPFNKIKGKNKFENMFQKFLQEIKDPEFKTLNITNDKSTYFVKWNFTGIYKKRFSFDGMSEIIVKNNLVIRHIDYWDSGRNFYCNIPLLKYIFKKIHK